MELTTIKTLKGGVIHVMTTTNPQSGNLWLKTNYFNGWKLIDDEVIALAVDSIIGEIKKGIKTEFDLIGYLNKVDLTQVKYQIGDRFSKSNQTTQSTQITQDENLDPNDILKREAMKQHTIETVDKLCNFFIEFDYRPSIRFLNTLINTTEKVRKNYIINYFSLSGRPETEDLIEKMKSPEFTEIMENLKVCSTNTVVNKRLQIYFGEPGTGKTYKAIQDNLNSKVMICESDFMPQQLFKVFDFNDETGKPHFKDSALVEAMKNGERIIIDEINLLNNQCLRALQEITDNKESFEYDGRNYEIKEGFEIIGTMNLYVNGQCYGLPEPLVDRCSNIKEFKINAQKTCLLAGLI